MAPVEHKLLANGILMVKMGLSYVKTCFLPVDDTFHSEFVLNRVSLDRTNGFRTRPREWTLETSLATISLQRGGSMS